MFTSIFIAGLGGQGVVTLAKIIAGSSAELGFKVSLLNATGMAQRGSRVTSEIRISSAQDFKYGSQISKGGADILVGMEVGEAANSFSYLKEDGLVLLLNHAFVPASMILKKEAYPTYQQVMRLFRQKTNSLFGVANPQSPHNIFLLGVFGSVLKSLPTMLPGLTCNGLEKMIRKNLKQKIKKNISIFQRGCCYDWKQENIQDNHNQQPGLSQRPTSIKKEA